MAGIALGIIPARGGSKGIPDKNIYPLLGKPLIVYTIEAALKSKALDDVIVSTDSECVATMAKNAGANVPFLRPAELALDQTATVEVLQHAVKTYEAQMGRQADTLVLLQPTTPLRLSEDIDGAIWMFRSHPKSDSLITCCNSAAAHPQYMYRKQGDCMVRFLNDAKPVYRRQEFEQIYTRNGAIYISTRNLILEQGKIVGDRPLGYIMPKDRSVNVDEIFDLELACFLIERRKREAGVKP